MVECANRDCWALRVVLDEVIESLGPWWLAHFIATTQNKAAAAALENYLKIHWPAYAESVEQLIAAASWTKETNLAREFGED